MSYETDEEKVQALKAWWQQYGNAVLTGVVVAAVIFGGWRFWQNHKISTSQAASQHYQQLLQNLEDDDQDALQLRAETLLADYGSTPYADLTQLILADTAIAEQRWDDAIAAVQSVAEQGNQALRPVARLRWARLLVAQQQLEQALAVLPAKDESAYQVAYLELKGDILVALERGDDARSAYADALAAEGEGSPLLQMKFDNLAQPAEIAQPTAAVSE